MSPHAQGERKTGVIPPGLAGSFFRPLAMAYVLVTCASLVVALTVTPAMSLLLLPGRSDRRREAPLVTLLKKPYRGALPALISRPSWALAGLGGLLAAALLTVPLLGEEFLPKFQEYDFLMHWVEKPGTSLEAMDRITIRAWRLVLLAMLSLPFALIGGVLGVWLGGGSLSPAHWWASSPWWASPSATAS